MATMRPATAEEIEDLRKGMSRRRFMRKWRCGTSRYERLQREVTGDMLALPPPRTPPLPAHVQLVDTDIVVAGDWHVPYYDPTMAAMLISEAQRLEIDTLVLNGDFLDEEVFFAGGMEHPPFASAFATELATARRLLQELLRVFNHIVWVAGNHERRLYRMTGGEIALSALATIALGGGSEAVTTTDRDYITAHYTGSRPWRITHGQGGSVKQPLRAALEKANSYDTNVIQGHNHLWGLTHTADGRHIAIDHGCMVDPRRISYRELNTRTYAQPKQGFAIVRDGRVRLYDKDWLF